VSKKLLHQLESSLACLLVSGLIVLLTACLFIKITRYNDWAEIARGNPAAALALGGKVLGAANVMRVAVHTNSGVVDTVVWGLVGMVLLLLTYLVFEWVTPRLNVNRAIAEGNVAVGIMSMVFSLALSMLIGASIS
jgi:putative membrane protein